MLIDINMYKKNLATEVNISSAKMVKGENISMDISERICNYMDCDIRYIINFNKIDSEKVPSNSNK